MSGRTFAPTAAQGLLLGFIKYRESRGNYRAQNPISSASGAYSFIDDTWHGVSHQTNVGIEYIHAKDAPPVEQDYNALWLLTEYGPNSPYSWHATGPYPTLAECEFALEFA